MQSILHQFEKKNNNNKTLFCCSFFFFFFFCQNNHGALWFKIWYIAYARHILNIGGGDGDGGTGRDKKKEIGTCCHCWWWGTFAFSFWFSFCVLYLLWIYLFWAELEVDLWHWLTLFIETTHTYTHAHSLCSEQMQCKSDRFVSLPPDELWLLNLSTWWPKVIDRYWLNMQGFSLMFFSYGDATLFSAVVCIILFTQPFFCLEINKMYYIHIASMPGSFCSSSAFSLLSRAATRLENVHHSHVPSPLCTFVLVCLHCSAWDSHCGDRGSLHISGLWPCQVSRASVLYLQQPVHPLLALSCLLFFFSSMWAYTHTYTQIYIHILSYVLNSEAKKGPRDRLIALLVRALSCLPSRARLKFTDRERFLLRPGVDS